MGAHRHHHSSHSGKRNWKTYFWEFLMLFLAILCGSYAEYLLEHKIEADREKSYAKSLMIDLVSDTVMLSNTINYAEQLNNGFDSIQKVLYEYTDTKENRVLLYHLNFTYSRWILTDFNDRTSSQLRYSGNLRLIKDNLITDELASYWIGANDIIKNSEIFIEKMTRAEEIGTNIFNRSYISFEEEKNFELNNIIVNAEAQLLSTDKNSLIAYANRFGRLKDISFHYLIPLMKRQREMGKDLYHRIKKEYNL